VNLVPCFSPVGLSLKRWSIVFILAMAAIYAVRPGVARADFTMQYTGAPFGELAAFDGTLLNFPAADTTVTIDAIIDQWRGTDQRQLDGKRSNAPQLLALRRALTTTP
jgi:hypothetical protein